MRRREFIVGIGGCLGVATGVAVGGFAVEGLHAQANAPVYYISEIDVRDSDAYSKEYAPKAQPIIKALPQVGK